MSAALTHRDYHKSGLCQAVGAYGHACEGVVHGFDLRTGIHVVDYRIGLGGVHIEGLEHHAVEVGDAVGGFYLKRLGELVAGGKKLREVGFLEGHYLFAESIAKVGAGHGVDARIVVHHKAAVLVHNRSMEIIAGGNHTQAGAIEAHAVEVLIVGVFVLLAAAGAEVDGAGALIHLQHVFHVPAALCDAIFELAFAVVEIEVCPTVAFAPVYQFLTAVHGIQAAKFLIGVHTLLYERHYGVLAYGVGADVDAMQVAARAIEIEMIVVAEPYGGLIGVPRHALVARRVFQSVCLMLKARCVHLLASVVGHVEHIEVLYGSFHLAGHLIFIGFERWARACHRIDYPQLLHLTVVLDDSGKVARVGRPGTPSTATLAVAQRVGVEHRVGYAIAKVLGAVGGELYFHYGAVVFVLERLLIVGITHAIKVAILGKHHYALVGRHIGPVGSLLFSLFLVGKMLQGLSGEIPLKEERLFAAAMALFALLFILLFAVFIVFFRFFHILGRHNLKRECFAILQHLKVLNRQMAGLKGVLNNGSEFGSQFIAVPKRSFGASNRVNHPPKVALTGFVFIPERAALSHPMRVHRGAEEHGIKFIFGKLLSL